MSSSSERNGDALVGLAVLMLAGLVGTVWLGATLAAVLSGHGLSGAGVGDAVAAGTRLPARLSAPAAAWHPAVAAQLPGPALYWAATAIAVPAVWLPAVGLLRWWAEARVGTTRRRPLGVDARPAFARPRDLAPLVVRHPQPGRFVLGRVGRRLVATENRPRSRRPIRRRRRQGDRGAVALIGPSRSGKTAAAVAGILDWDGPAVLSSVKTDLWAPTVGWRRRLGDCRVFDPTGYTGAGCAGWSPLRAADSFTGAQRAARALCDAAPRDGVEGGADFWLAQAEILLSGLLWVARAHGLTMADVVEWVMVQDRPGEHSPGTIAPLIDADLEAGVPAVVAHAQPVSRCLMAIWSMDERTRASVYATAQTVVWAWADPGVAAAAHHQDIDLDWLVARTNTLYLCAPIEDQRRLVPAFGGLLNDLIGQIYRRVAATGRPLDPPLLVVLDEAGNTPLRALPEYVSTLAGLGVVLVTAWQSVAQIKAGYGRHADTIMTNHLTKVFFSGLSDLASLDYVGRMLGDEEVETTSHSGDPHGWPGSQSVATTRVGMVPPHTLRQMRPGHALLIHGTLPPAHLRPRPYYRVRALRARATLPTDPSPGGADDPSAAATPRFRTRPRHAPRPPTAAPIPSHDPRS